MKVFFLMLVVSLCVNSVLAFSEKENEMEQTLLEREILDDIRKAKEADEQFSSDVTNRVNKMKARANEEREKMNRMIENIETKFQEDMENTFEGFHREERDEEVKKFLPTDFDFSD